MLERLGICFRILGTAGWLVGSLVLFLIIAPLLGLILCPPVALAGLIEWIILGSKHIWGLAGRVVDSLYHYMTWGP